MIECNLTGPRLRELESIISLVAHYGNVHCSALLGAWGLIEIKQTKYMAQYA